jgi:acyl-coenzyme A synthetase/AMP-(fatty) acid ligase
MSLKSKEVAMHVEAGSLVRIAAEQFGPRIALSAGARAFTFSELNESANRIGSALRAGGVARGDRVGVLAYNTPEVVTAWFGFEKHNLVRVVLHSHFAMDAHVFSLNQVEASTLVFDTRFAADVARQRERLETVRLFVAIGPDCPEWAVPFSELEAGGSPVEPNLDVDEDAPCFLQLTSGTTGQPKAWVKTYRSWQAVINHNLHHFDTFGPTVPPINQSDINLHFHPLQWASGFQTLYPYFVRGARSVLLDDQVFDPDILIETLEREAITGIFMPGPLLSPILDAIERRGGIEHRLRRMVIFFGTPDLLERTTRLMGPVWAHGFGSTEQGAVTTRLLPHEVVEQRRRIASVGRPGSPFMEVAVVDENGKPLGANKVGEIVVRSAMSIGEYWGMPEKTADAFFPGNWFRPFDVGYLDDNGYLFYVDRAGDRIVTEHGVVFPHLIEEAMMRHPAVALCGVVGLGASGKQAVVAAVQLKPGHAQSRALGDEMKAQTAHFAAHEQPSVIFVEELPTVLGGAKVQRGELRQALARSQR